MGCSVLCAFLGAGFSKWAAALPVAAELFDLQIEPFGKRESAALKLVTRLKRDWDMAHPNGLAEQFIAEVLNSGTKAKEAVLWYVVRRLSAPFIWKEYHAHRQRRHVLAIDEHRSLDVPGVVEAREFLWKLCSPRPAGIITTNYDMLVEYALGTKGFNYGSPGEVLIGRGPYPLSHWRNPVRLTGELPLAKIHGSISWDKNGRYTDGRRGLAGRALVAPPVPEKQPTDQLRPVWTLAEHILERSTALVCFGFAFNPYDSAVLSLLRDAGRRMRSILLIDICLLYTSPSPRDRTRSRMPSSA